MIVLGLGSSDDRALHYLRSCINELRSWETLNVSRISPLYESDAMLPPGGAPPSWNRRYYNLALSCDIHDGTGPLDLLVKIKQLEKKLGRQERERWAPREIDIDILAWDDLVLETPQLTLPHPGLLDRPFALLPLNDVASSWMHPKEAFKMNQTLFHWKQLQRIGEAHLPFHTKRSIASLTQLVGILNLTPDSFSDGGNLHSSDLLVKHAENLILAGADILDVGAESTRPGGQVVDDTLEWERLNQFTSVFENIKKQFPQIKWSLDTRHVTTMNRALERFSWDIINDVEGWDTFEKRKLAKAFSGDIVAMHSLGVPPTQTQHLDSEHDPIEQLLNWGQQKIAEFQDLNFPLSRLILDPGVGFGKTIRQNWIILSRIDELQTLKCPILVGHSRKSFLKSITPLPPEDRDWETAAISQVLEENHVNYLRVHDVDKTRRAIVTQKMLRSFS